MPFCQYNAQQRRITTMLSGREPTRRTTRNCQPVMKSLGPFHSLHQNISRGGDAALSDWQGLPNTQPHLRYRARAHVQLISSEQTCPADKDAAVSLSHDHMMCDIYAALCKNMHPCLSTRLLSAICGGVICARVQHHRSRCGDLLIHCESSRRGPVAD